MSNKESILNKFTKYSYHMPYNFKIFTKGKKQIQQESI